jgi:hypothetical protein
MFLETRKTNEKTTILHGSKVTQVFKRAKMCIGAKQRNNPHRKRTDQTNGQT